MFKHRKKESQNPSNHISVDRLEENIAICVDDNGQTHKINVLKLPKNVKEGDILKCLNNGCFEIDTKETEKRKQDIYNLQNSLFK